MKMSIGKAAEYLGVSQWKLRQLDKDGILIPSKPTGQTRYYTQEQLDEYFGVKRQAKTRITVGYCRVSSAKQRDDLERQIENVRQYLIAQGKPFEIIEDVGSGINYKKKGLQELIRKIQRGEVEKVVVLYKDRLLRFGYELLEFVASEYNTPIEVIDNTEKTEQQELVEDLVQIISMFSCQLQGKRANKARKVVSELVQELKNPAEADSGANEAVLD